MGFVGSSPTNSWNFWGPILGGSRTNSGQFPVNCRSSLDISQPDQRHCPDQLAPRQLPDQFNNFGASPKPSQHLPDPEKSRAQTDAERVPNQFWGLPDHVWASPGPILGIARTNSGVLAQLPDHRPLAPGPILSISRTNSSPDQL